MAAEVVIDTMAIVWGGQVHYHPPLACHLLGDDSHTAGNYSSGVLGWEGSYIRPFSHFEVRKLETTSALSVADGVLPCDDWH